MEHIVFIVPEPQIMEEIVDMFDDLMLHVVEQSPRTYRRGNG